MRPPDARLLALVAPERPLVQVDVELPVEVAEKPPERPSARAQTLPSAKAATRFDWRAATLIAAVLFGTGALAAVAFRHAVRIQPTSPEAVVGALAQNAPVVLPGVDREVDLLVHGRVAPAADIDRAAAVSVVEAIARDKAEACGFASGPAFARVVVTFAPSGRAKGAAIVGGLGNTREGRCLARALLAARVPDFVGQSTSVPVTVRLR